MSDPELQDHDPDAGVHGDSFQLKRSSSPVPSGVSLKSERSMNMPINYSGESLPPESGIFPKRSSSPVPSGVSLKSERSMNMPINYSGESWAPESGFYPKRSSSPVPSGVSLKSERSMNMPINYSGESLPPESGIIPKRSSSPVPSGVSLKSERSMNMPINYSGESWAPESGFYPKRSSSPVPSGVSLKSERSMNMPINYSGESLPPESGFRPKRSSSPVPSDVSLKSARSMNMPINYSGKLFPPVERFGSGILKTLRETLKLMFKERYQHLFEGKAQQGSPTLLNKIYTELYITEGLNKAHGCHHEGSHIEAAMKMVHGGTQVKCNNIFNPLSGHEKPIKIVLTKGVAGIGKTVSVQKFILDWAEGKANQDVHFIFPLPFREINLMRDQKYSLNDLLQHFIMKGIDASLSRITNHSLVFILDGLDECRLPLDFPNNESLWDPTKETSVDILLTNLIKGNLLPSAKIWITSRPAAAGLIPSDCVDRITEVRGFDEPQKEEYFRKRISDQSLASRIITHLKSLRSLYIMCHIPVFCWIAATVLERMVEDCGWDKIPRSLTQMYTYFLITQIHTKREKYSESKVTDKEMIAKLGKLAFEQLQKGNLIFYEEDLRECGIDVREASVYSGVFTQIFREEFGLFQKKVFSFVHLSIQEHLAALYVFLSFQNCGQNVLDPQQDSGRKEPATMFSLLQTAVDKASESDSGHLDLFLRFLMGFSLESNQILIQDLLVQGSSRSPAEVQETISYLKEKIKGTPCSYMFLKCFHCLYELNDRSLMDEIQAFLRNRKQNEDHLSPELWSALAFIIITSDEKLDVFELSKYGRSDDALLHLIAVFKLSRTARFNHCNITARGCAALTFALPIMTATKELDLSHNNVQDAGVKMLCTGIQGDTVEQKLMNCSGIKEEKSVNQLCRSEQSLVWDNTAKLLYRFIDALNQKHSINEFPGLRGTVCNIQILRLNSCGITSVGCAFLAEVLSSNSSNLKDLDLGQNNIGDEGVKVLSDALKRAPCKLANLKLNECGVTEESCAALALALSSESACLRELDLSFNDLKDSGAKLLSAGLGNPNCELQKLILYSCNIAEEGHSALNEALQSNPSLLKVLSDGQ
ncbi:NACHT, LRR and PYD domains-containing protein 3-like [Salminus brasiliensis]|uniref:NACHT, LRR and PYD domains-containing protein 3-like n=1 Tax=Salminus brasiliensis TaxID=930266 RepID=UPI003B832172